MAHVINYINQLILFINSQCHGSAHLTGAAALLAVIFLDGCTPRGPSSYRPSYPGARWIDKKDIRFDDGDTFFLKDTPIRIIGIDTPEVADPNIGIYEDQPYGTAASDSTRALITRATVVDYVPDGRDRYGRLLAHVFVDGELLALHLPALRAFVRLRLGPMLRAKESASDIVQSACRDVLENLHRFQYRGEAGFKAWLYKTALRKVADRAEFWRAAKRDPAREVRPAPLPDASQASMADIARALGSPSVEAISSAVRARSVT